MKAACRMITRPTPIEINAPTTLLILHRYQGFRSLADDTFSLSLEFHNFRKPVNHEIRKLTRRWFPMKIGRAYNMVFQVSTGRSAGQDDQSNAASATGSLAG